MGKKMSQLQQNQSNDSVHFPNLIKTHSISRNNQRPENQRANQEVDQLKIQTSQIGQQTIELQQIGINNCQKQQTQKQIPSYRFSSYKISNKQYRLVSLVESSDSEQNGVQADFMNLNGNNQRINDFREPQNVNANFGARMPVQRRNYLERLRQNWLRQHNQNRNRRSYTRSIVNYCKKLYRLVKSIQLSSFLDYIPFYTWGNTLQSKYKFISLAILNNSINLQSSVIKALEYNIPLMQIIINPKNPKQQEIVRQKILKCFNISHFINQNFVLYGDWQYEKYKNVFRENYQKDNSSLDNQFGEYGKIVFRKGQHVFAEIDLMYVDKIDQNEFQQKLQKIRDQYYRKINISSLSNSRISSSQSQNNIINRQSQIISQIKNYPYPDIIQNDSFISQKKSPIKDVEQIRQQILEDYLIKRRQQQQQQKRKRNRQKKSYNFDIAGHLNLQIQYEYENSDHESNSNSNDSNYVNSAFSTPKKNNSRVLQNNQSQQQVEKQQKQQVKQKQKGIKIGTKHENIVKNSPFSKKQRKIQLEQQIYKQLNNHKNKQKYEQKQEKQQKKYDQKQIQLQKQQKQEDQESVRSYVRHWRNM